MSSSLYYCVTSERLEVMRWLLTRGRQSTGLCVRLYLISWDASILFPGTPLSYFLGRLYIISWDASILFPGTPLSYFLGRPWSIIIHVPTTGWPDLAELLCIEVAQHAIIIMFISAWSELKDHDMLMLVSVVDTLAWYDILVIKHRWTNICISQLYVAPIGFNCKTYIAYNVLLRIV